MTFRPGCPDLPQVKLLLEKRKLIVLFQQEPNLAKYEDEFD